MTAILLAIFALGYLLIAFEHKLKVNKSAIALLMCGSMWTAWNLLSTAAAPDAGLSDRLGETCEVLIYLIGAMTIVNLIDIHGGFHVITDRITTRRKRPLLWLLTLITFFMSALLDNMTTTIIMIMVMRRLVASRSERWIYASLIVIAANSGGAWSPIGDVTTLMLWTKGNLTALRMIAVLILPCFMSVAVPLLFAARMIPDTGVDAVDQQEIPARPAGISVRFSHTVLLAGIASLLFVPVFKSLTGLPPYMGMTIALGFMWTMTEIFYSHHDRDIDEPVQNRVTKVLRKIDMPTILFFLGILMSVAALQTAGILTAAADLLDRHIHEIFAISGVVGICSALIDNVALVAASMGMYPVADPAAVAAAADPAYLQAFTQSGLFWQLLAFCASAGGSLLIIGSAAGVVAMGLEKIDFGWYLRRITLLVLAGYLAGTGIIWLEHLLFGV